MQQFSKHFLISPVWPTRSNNFHCLFCVLQQTFCESNFRRKLSWNSFFPHLRRWFAFVHSIVYRHVIARRLERTSSLLYNRNGCVQGCGSVVVEWCCTAELSVAVSNLKPEQHCKLCCAAHTTCVDDTKYTWATYSRGGGPVRMESIRLRLVRCAVLFLQHTA